MFTSTSGEHLNKQLKFLESGHTDLSRSRYQQVLRLLRVRMFHFTTSVLDDPAREMTCSRCKQKGHNRKNKSCPMHPSQPPMEFDEDAAVQLLNRTVQLGTVRLALSFSFVTRALNHLVIHWRNFFFFFAQQGICKRNECFFFCTLVLVH